MTEEKETISITPTELGRLAICYHCPLAGSCTACGSLACGEALIKYFKEQEG